MADTRSDQRGGCAIICRESAFVSLPGTGDRPPGPTFGGRFSAARGSGRGRLASLTGGHGPTPAIATRPIATKPIATRPIIAAPPIATPRPFGSGPCCCPGDAVVAGAQFRVECGVVIVFGGVFGGGVVLGVGGQPVDALQCRGAIRDFVDLYPGVLGGGDLLRSQPPTPADSANLARGGPGVDPAECLGDGCVGVGAKCGRMGAGDCGRGSPGRGRRVQPPSAASSRDHRLGAGSERGALELVAGDG